MERCGQFKGKPHDLALTHLDERGDNFDFPVAGTGADELLEGFVIGGTAVGIAGAVLLNGTDNDFLRVEDFCPADRCGEEMRVAERNVGNGNGFSYRFGLRMKRGRVGDGDVGVGEGRASDLSKDVDL